MSINQTKLAIEDHPATDTVNIDHNEAGAVVRTMVDNFDDDFRSFVEDELGASILNSQYVGFGTEVEVSTD